MSALRVGGRRASIAALALLSAVFTLVAPTPTVADAATGGEPAAYEQFNRTIGRSLDRRPIKAFFRGDPAARHQVVVMGQIHGDEKAGLRVARALKRHWSRHGQRPKAGTGLWIVPTMNPDGNVRNRRQNRNGVDLNRNFPTSGWSGSSSACCWGGPRAGSAPETRAMVRFLRDVKPDYVVALHQPFAKVAANGEKPRFERRLGRQLRLPVDEVSIGYDDDDDGVAPSLTSWYNDRLGRHGTSVTVEFPRHTSAHYRRNVAAPGLLRAMRVWQRPTS